MEVRIRTTVQYITKQRLQAICFFYLLYSYSFMFLFPYYVGYMVLASTPSTFFIHSIKINVSVPLGSLLFPKPLMLK